MFPQEKQIKYKVGRIVALILQITAVITFFSLIVIINGAIALTLIFLAVINIFFVCVFWLPGQPHTSRLFGF